MEYFSFEGSLIIETSNFWTLTENKVNKRTHVLKEIVQWVDTCHDSSQENLY